MNHPIVDDMVDLRNLATHSSYEKRLRDGEWQVQNPRPETTPYESRELESYAAAVHQHGRELVDIIDRLAAELAEEQSNWRI